MCVHTCAYLQLIDVLQYAMCTHKYIATSTLLVYCVLYVLPYVSVCQRHIFLELDFYGYACIAIGISTQDIDCSNKHEEELLPHFILKTLLLSACFILVPSIFCSSPNQIHPPPFLLTAQQHILCSFQARHIAQLMRNNLHIRICFTCLLDFSPFPKPAPQPSHHLGPERRRR